MDDRLLDLLQSGVLVTLIVVAERLFYRWRDRGKEEGETKKTRLELAQLAQEVAAEAMETQKKAFEMKIGRLENAARDRQAAFSVLTSDYETLRKDMALLRVERERDKDLYEQQLRDLSDENKNLRAKYQTLQRKVTKLEKDLRAEREKSEELIFKNGELEQRLAVYEDSNG